MTWTKTSNTSESLLRGGHFLFKKNKTKKKQPFMFIIFTCQWRKNWQGSFWKEKGTSGFIWLHASWVSASPGAATVMQTSKWHGRKGFTWFHMKTDKTFFLLSAVDRVEASLQWRPHRLILIEREPKTIQQSLLTKNFSNLIFSWF